MMKHFRRPPTKDLSHKTNLYTHADSKNAKAANKIVCLQTYRQNRQDKIKKIQQRINPKTNSSSQTDPTNQLLASLTSPSDLGNRFKRLSSRQREKFSSSHPHERSSSSDDLFRSITLKNKESQNRVIQNRMRQNSQVMKSYDLKK